MTGPIVLDRELELRLVGRKDLDLLYTAVIRNRARLAEWLPWAALPYDQSEMLRYLLERERENTAGESLSMHLWAGQTLCGAVALHRFDLQHKHTSIGYWLDSGLEGRGIMTQACRAIVTEGFTHYGMHRIEIRCGTGNRKSAAIPQRLGFVEEGVLREAERIADRWIDLRLFSMLARDWK